MRGKEKIVAAIWAMGILFFAGWVIGTFGGIPLIALLRIESQLCTEILAWLMVGGFALSGSIISIGFLFKHVWKLPDEAIFEKLPKGMR